MTILVVDDNEQNLELIEVFLGGSGYQVVTADNGTEALAKARQNPPGLIISDILMPVMDGFALCREWKKDERLRLIPFVFYTATYTDERDREFALSLGAARFLVKPMEPKAFVQTIREVIQQIQCPPAASSRGTIEAPLEEEAGYLQQYNAVLIHKLEAKIQQLDQTNRELGQNFAECKQRKQAEEALKRSESLLQKIFDILPIGLWFADKEGKLLRGNPMGIKIWGAEPKVSSSGYGVFKARRLPSGAEIAPDDWALARTIRNKVTIVDELLEIDAFDGNKKVILNSTAPVLDDQGKLQGAIVVNQDITERKQAETELKESHEQLRILAQHLQREGEKERARIAKELHDELGQTLTAIKIDYACLQKKLGLLQKPLGEEVKDLSGLIDTAINTVRKLTMDLRPAMLDDLGLIPAIEWMIKGVQKRAGIKSELTVKPSRLKLGPDLSLTIFRIVQEALTNVIRYAQATRVQIVLEKGPGCFNLMVKDNGIGIQQKQIKSYYSLGLVGIKERVTSYGGKLEITGEKGKGTTIKVFIPLKKGKSENTYS